MREPEVVVCRPTISNLRQIRGSPPLEPLVQVETKNAGVERPCVCTLD